VLAAVDDVAGKFSKTEGEFSAKKQKSTDDHEEPPEKEQSAPELTERIHKSIIEGPSRRRESTDGFRMESRLILSFCLRNKQTERILSNPKK
jgi:hypothetical protein